MERWWIGLGGLAMLGALSQGCGSPCEGARERIRARYVECALPPPEPDEPIENEVCSSADGELQKCIADCTESASCETLTGQSPQGSADLTECYADCAR